MQYFLSKLGLLVLRLGNDKYSLIRVIIMFQGKKIESWSGLRARCLRLDQGLTYKQIANRLDISVSTAHDYVNLPSLPEMVAKNKKDAEKLTLFLLLLQKRIPRKYLADCYREVFEDESA